MPVPNGLANVDVVDPAKGWVKEYFYKENVPPEPELEPEPEPGSPLDDEMSWRDRM
jgi:hypothetical protein